MAYAPEVNGYELLRSSSAVPDAARSLFTLEENALEVIKRIECTHYL